MITIEFSPKEESYLGPSQSGLLVINGALVNDSWALKYTDELVGGIYDPDMAAQVIRAPLQEVFSNLNEIGISFNVEWCEDVATLKLIDGQKNNTPACLKLEFHFESEEWARPWSILDFAEVLQDVVQERATVGLAIFRDDNDFVTNGFGFKCRIEDLKRTAEEEIREWTPELKAALSETIRRLTIDSVGTAISQVFRFPPEIAVACEQYLIYFGQFLEDLGIDASVDISHFADHTLFRVTPKDAKEALEAIRSALDDYLGMPGDIGLEAALGTSSDIAALQLRANISHLQSQLVLAQAVLEAKDATIHSLRLTNYQLQEFHNHQQMTLSGSERAKEGEDSESVIEGIISVKTAEIKGFLIVRWPEIIRKLKRRFQRKD